MNNVIWVVEEASDKWSFVDRALWSMLRVCWDKNIKLCSYKLQYYKTD
jgi:hypothetical protein